LQNVLEKCRSARDEDAVQYQAVPDRPIRTVGARRHGVEVGAQRRIAYQLPAQVVEEPEAGSGQRGGEQGLRGDESGQQWCVPVAMR